jgi:hypothetical protein
MKNTKKEKKLLEKFFSERLKGQVVFHESIWQEHGQYFAFNCRRNAEHKDFVERGVQPTDASAIYNIQCLEFTLTNAMGMAICCGLFYLSLKKAGQKVVLCAPDSNGPSMGLKIIELVVLTDLHAKEWTLDTFRKTIPEACRSAINCYGSCPDIAAGYQNAIKAFEV